MWRRGWQNGIGKCLWLMPTLKPSCREPAVTCRECGGAKGPFTTIVLHVSDCIIGFESFWACMTPWQFVGLQITTPVTAILLYTSPRQHCISYNTTSLWSSSTIEAPVPFPEWFTVKKIFTIIRLGCTVPRNRRGLKSSAIISLLWGALIQFWKYNTHFHRMVFEAST